MIRMLTKRGLRASDLVCSPDVADTIINDAAVQKLLDNRRIEIGNVELSCCLTALPSWPA